MSDYSLSPVEETKLKLLISDPQSVEDLVVHYHRVYKVFREMGEEEKTETIFINGRKHKRKPQKVIQRLKEDIMDLDGKLFSIVTNPALKTLVRLGHEEVCRLFAKNALTVNPVLPREVRS